MGNHRFNPHARGNVVGALPHVVKDVHGRPLEVGDQIVMPQLTLPHLQVARVAPSLNPAAPPNSMEVVVRMQMLLLVPADAPLEQFLLVRTKEELEQVYGKPAEVPATTPADPPAAAPATPPPDGPRLVTE